MFRHQVRSHLISLHLAIKDLESDMVQGINRHDLNLNKESGSYMLDRSV